MRGTFVCSLTTKAFFPELLKLEKFWLASLDSCTSLDAPAVKDSCVAASLFIFEG